MAISVGINAGPAASSSSVVATGTIQHVISDAERTAFNIKTSQTSRSFYTAAQAKAQFYTRFSSSLPILNPRFGGSLRLSTHSSLQFAA
ncbi:hypothetical protein [Xanthomonas sp. 3075]|uniref:hypothetical protein n=1 Tax=Xanthomonas sp. 3075 TaxID=3035315 RepID=UPI0016217E5F|nr:hypothetical protein [Xanthomonas sp. 3075]MBB4129869.1 hypothetical protein [Xanthomonas sp. 3075]